MVIIRNLLPAGVDVSENVREFSELRAIEAELSDRFYKELVLSEAREVTDTSLNNATRFMSLCSDFCKFEQVPSELNWCVKKYSQYRSLLMNLGVYTDVLKYHSENTGKQPFESERQSNGQGLFGRAAQDSFNKTVPVVVTRVSRHPKTKKTIRSSKRYLAHDEFNQVNKGDSVYIRESRPISKRKNFTVTNVRPT